MQDANLPVKSFDLEALDRPSRAALDRAAQGEYDQTALDIINQSAILEESDIRVLTDLREELFDNFKHAQVFRTRTEMEVSVLNDTKFPTPDSKYWQAQREQQVHFHELVMLSYEYRKNIVEIKKLRRRLDQEKDDLERELVQIEVERMTFIARNQERMAKDRIREIREWHEIKEYLTPQMEYSNTDCGEHQLLSYTKRWIKQVIQAGDSGGPAERSNLLSQMEMGIRACIGKGILHKALKDFPAAVRNQIASKYGVKLIHA